jgi:type IX secretion system PorP/SprF family membrane protein
MFGVSSLHKRFIGAALCMLVNFSVLSQRDPQFSQYMFNKSYWSPSLTAIDGKSSLSFFSRSQWLGYDTPDDLGGSPNTQFVNASLPLLVYKIPISFGPTIILDQQGPFTEVHVQISMAYHYEFPRGTLSAGIRPSIINQTLESSSLIFVNPTDGPPAGHTDSQFTGDLDIGVSYKTTNVLVALGVHHLLQPKYDYGLGSSDEPSTLLYNVFGEYEYALSYNIILMPSILAQTDIGSYSYNIGMIAKYNEKMWGGLSYRNSESAVIILGYSFLQNNSLKLGYSFDYIIKEQSGKQQTSHEIYLRYNLPSIDIGSKKIIRTPRFRF